MNPIFLNGEKKFSGKYALWHTGFRPFFSLAGVFGFVFILFWGGIFFHNQPALGQMYFLVGSIAWHAHEMIFGFAGAVIAGFLLTAVKNWTKIPTFTGKPLALLAILWIVSRVLPFLKGEGTLFIGLNAFLECSFWGILAARCTQNIVRVKAWNQFAIIGKVWLFIPFVLVFHLGLAGVWQKGVVVGLYGGFYLVLALILTFSRRVLPMFIERGLNNGFIPQNSRAVDKWSLLLFLIFSALELFRQTEMNATLNYASGVLAGVQALLHFYRLSLWHHPLIWKKPLLFSLIGGYVFFILGFVSIALNAFWGVGTMSLCVHLFGIGAIGLFAFGMMARIALGHTGRSVFSPPKGLNLVFYGIFASVFSRVFLVLLFPENTTWWIFIAQGCWIFSSLLFCLLYLPILIRARIDGVFG